MKFLKRRLRIKSNRHLNLNKCGRKEGITNEKKSPKDL